MSQFRLLINETQLYRFQSGQPATAINVGAILGLARGLMMLKAAPKAKIQLKRVLNYRWSLEDADYLEQCK